MTNTTKTSGAGKKGAVLAAAETMPVLATVEGLKAQARRLRDDLSAEGHLVGHSRSLELVAHQHGYRDWNTLHAAARTAASPSVADLRLGAAVSGRYLGQSFTGKLIALKSLAGGERFGTTIRFDAPVDVVAFESFSAFRRQVSVTVDAGGRTAQKTSNGERHLTLAL